MNTDSRTNKVFVTQEMPKLDYLPAEKFGEIVFLSNQDLSPVAGSMHNQQLIERIKGQLEQYNKDRDYLVVSGSPILAAAVFAILGRRTNAFRMLRWSNRDNNYIPVSITV